VIIQEISSLTTRPEEAAEAMAELGHLQAETALKEAESRVILAGVNGKNAEERAANIQQGSAGSIS